MKTKLLAFLVVTGLLLSACGGVQSQADPCPYEQDGYNCIRNEQTSQWMLVVASARLTSSMQWVPASAATAEQIAQGVGVYSVSASQLVLQGVLLPAALVASPNIVQYLAEGPQTLQYGDKLAVSQMDGSVQVITITNSDAVQKASEGDKQMSTPQPKKLIIIDDDLGWGNIIKLHLTSLGFSVRVCPTFCDEPDVSFFIIDGQDPQEQIVGPGFIRSIRSVHPSAFIVGISGRLDSEIAGSATIRAQFIAAGANAVINKGGSIEEQIKALFSQ